MMWIAIANFKCSYKIIAVCAEVMASELIFHLVQDKNK